MENRMLAALHENPIVAAVTSEDLLEASLASQCEVVFILFGDICSIGTTVSQVKQAGKLAIVHIDLVHGLASKDISVEFIRRQTGCDGMISTRPALIKKAHEVGLLTVQRSFIFDSLSLENMKKQMQSGFADMVEVLPAAMPKIIREIVAAANVPIIAGGLIRDKEDILSALAAGAVGVSTTSKEVWFM